MGVFEIPGRRFVSSEDAATWYDFIQLARRMRKKGLMS